MKKAILNSISYLVIVIAVSALLWVLPDYYKRIFGQFLSISATMTVALVCYAHFSCVRRRVLCSIWQAVKGDKRRLMVFLRNKRAVSLALTGISTTFITIGLISQIYGNQVADKPVFFHLATPMLCVVLFWVATNQLNNNGHPRKNQP